MKNSETILQLNTLGYKAGDRVWYRGFYPEKGKDNGRKAQAVYPELPGDLEQWEREGRGVYAVINPGGHTDKEITHGLAVWYEHDHLEKEISRDLWQGLGLPEPTFQVDTGGRSVHSYWVFSEPITIEQWRSLQTDLLEFADGDRTLKNPSRVMRLAGFTHPKTGQPATIASNAGERYDYATLRAIIPQATKQAQATPQGPTWSEFDRSFSLPYPEAIPLEVCLSTASRKALEHGEGEGGRNAAGAALARDLIGTADHLGALGQRYDGDPWALFSEYCDRCSPPLPQGERETIWKSAQRANPGPSLSPEAVGNCAKHWLWKHRRPTTAAQGKAHGAAVDTWAAVGPGSPRLAVKLYEVQQLLNDRVELNELTNQIELDRQPIESMAVLRCNLALSGCTVSRADLEEILEFLAMGNKYNPVKEYLEKCHATHGNNADILEGLALRYFGVDDPLYQTFLVKTLIGAVARIYKPGCKVDNALILQGDQGVGKSSFFRVLAGDDWFDDSMGAAIGDKDERLKLHQFWFLEWAELEGVLRKRDIANVKAFMTCQVDTVRPPYGRNAISLKRRSIIVGSTNRNDFLSDSTGERRWWVIPVKQRIDTAMLKIERDAIWAAAVALYRSGLTWHLTREDEAQAAEYNEQWRSEDPWTPAIRAYLLQYHESEVTTAAILTHGLGVEVGQQTRSHEMRVSEIMKTLGWEKTQRRLGGKVTRLWLYQPTPPLYQPTPPLYQPITSGCDTPEPLQGNGCNDRTNCNNQNHQNSRKLGDHSLDISEEELAQLLGGDHYDN